MKERLTALPSWAATLALKRVFPPVRTLWGRAVSDPWQPPAARVFALLPSPDRGQRGIRGLLSASHSVPLCRLVTGAPPPPFLIFDPRAPKPAQIRPKKGRIFPSFWALRCKVQGGGGAPPTNLILLRNQRPDVSARRVRRHRTTGPRTGSKTEKNQRKKEKIFLLSHVVVEGGGRGARSE